MKGKHLALAAVLVVAAAAPAAAQRPGSLEQPAASATVSAPGSRLTPTLAATHSGISLEDAQPLTLNVSAARMGKREGRAFALVGGAAVIAGVLIGVTPAPRFAIGGAGLGLYGLYVWQR